MDENDENEEIEEGGALSGTVMPKTSHNGVEDSEDEADERDEPEEREAPPPPPAAAPGPSKPQTSKQLTAKAAKHLHALHEKAQQLQETFDALATATDVVAMQKQVEEVRAQREATAQGAAVLTARHKEADTVIGRFTAHRDQRKTWEEQTREFETVLKRVSDILSGRGDPEREARNKLYTLDEARRLLGSGR